MSTQTVTKGTEHEAEPVTIEEKVTKESGEVLTRHYLKGNFLGKGGFARCYEFKSLDSEKTFAAKIVPKASLSKTRAKQKLMTEIKIHRALHYPNIVDFEHFFEDTENVYILLELCTNQTMNELLKRRKRVTELEIQYYLLQIVQAVKYLHEHKVIHRDLKLGNMFLSDKLQVKVGDFGLATKIEFEGERKRTVCGTPNYIAPEVLDGKQGHSYEVDIWSIGVILYTLLYGKPPFETSDVKTTYRRIRMNAYSFPESIPISSQAKNLIERILVPDPSKRPSLDDIITHDFFRQGCRIPTQLPHMTLVCPPNSAFIQRHTIRLGETTLGIVRQDSRPSIGGSSLPSEKQKSTMEPPLPEPGVWVTKWVDYSSKYGVGYVLADGSVGVFFNDATKVVLTKGGGRFFYMERKDQSRQDHIVSYEIGNFPEQLRKKITLLDHFRTYLQGEKPATEDNSPLDISSPPIYVKKWLRNRHAIMFRLSNKLVQVDFQDHTQIILSSVDRVVTYYNKKGAKSAYLLSTALESGNEEMAKRLRYTKEILARALNVNPGEQEADPANPMTERQLPA